MQKSCFVGRLILQTIGCGEDWSANKKFQYDQKKFRPKNTAEMLVYDHIPDDLAWNKFVPYHVGPYKNVHHSTKALDRWTT